MGLAASQGRMLCLTARKNDLIYEAQQISQQRLALADQQQVIAENYTNAMNNTIMQAVAPDGSTQRLTYDLLTSRDPFSGLSMRILDSNGNIVVPGKNPTMTVKNEQGETEDFVNATDFVNKYMSGSSWSDEERSKASKMNIIDLVKFYSKSPNAQVGLDVSHSYSHLSTGADDERYCFDENVNDAEYVQQMLTSGEWTLEKLTDVKDNQNIFDSLTWQGSSIISEVYDTSDDAAAEAQYQSDMVDAQKRDKLLELRLEEVQTEESAVEKELDSVKSVIDKNVQDSFKTFA